MKTAHLQHHLRTKHPHQVGNSLEFFRKKNHGFTSCQENMKKITSASAKALEASYAVSFLLAKAKKPFSLAEELIIPAAAVLAETMVDKTAANKIKTATLSNDTVSCRIDKMGTDIVEQLVINSGLVNHFHFNWMNRWMSVDRRNWLLLRDMWIPATFVNTYFFAKHWRG